MSVLTDIQNELKVPKSRYNSFGEYHYRSLEDIVNAVKPLLSKYNATLTIWDNIEEIGGRVYVRATAEFKAKDECYVVSAFAREAEAKKKLDDSQITGVASSYARKYALNGLFLIDDTKDADTDEYAKQTHTEAGQIGKLKAGALETMIKECGQDVEKIKAYYKVNDLSELTEKQHSEILFKVRKNADNRKG